MAFAVAADKGTMEMPPASRTPEGLPSRCVICGAKNSIDYSAVGEDAPCPNCGHLLLRSAQIAEEIVAKLRQVDVLMAQGRQVADAVRAIGVTEVTYYRWRNEYGGLKGDQVKRLKELETENNRLRRAVSDLTLDKLILAEAAKGNF